MSLLYQCGISKKIEKKKILYNNGVTNCIWTPVISGSGAIAHDTGEYLEIDTGVNVGSYRGALLYTPVDITDEVDFILFYIIYHKTIHYGGSYSNSECIFCNKDIPQTNGVYNNRGTIEKDIENDSIYGYYSTNGDLPSPVLNITPSINYLRGLSYVGFGKQSAQGRCILRVNKIEIYYK